LITSEEKLESSESFKQKIVDEICTKIEELKEEDSDAYTKRGA